jgi:D-aminopeptidase
LKGRCSTSLRKRIRHVQLIHIACRTLGTQHKIPFERLLNAYSVSIAPINPTMADKKRARDFFHFDEIPGPLNAITDIQGLEIGMVTLISGEGPLELGKGPVRTGVTAILPRGKASDVPCAAGIYSHNGNGELTGSHWIKESGALNGPVVITNTAAVGQVYAGVVDWYTQNRAGGAWLLPVVAETYDGYLNDSNGGHVKPSHAGQAMDKAAPQIKVCSLRFSGHRDF